MPSEAGLRGSHLKDVTVGKILPQDPAAEEKNGDLKDDDDQTEKKR
jgi:hypothetical protein